MIADYIASLAIIKHHYQMIVDDFIGAMNFCIWEWLPLLMIDY